MREKRSAFDSCPARWAIRLAVLVLAAPLVASADGREMSAAEQRLFERLARHVDSGEEPVLTVRFGDDLVYEVRTLTGDRLEMSRRGSADGSPISWPWREVPIHFKIHLLESLSVDSTLRLDLARFCFDRGLEGKAHAHLKQAVDTDASLEAGVQAILADVLGPPEDGPSFEWFHDRFVAPGERERILVRNAEAWLLSRQAVEDERLDRADAVHDKARFLQRKGFFQLARGLFRKVAAMSPNTDIGLDAAEKASDNCLLIVEPIRINGDPQNRVDVYVLGDGYEIRDRHQASFRRAAGFVVDYFLEREVVGEYATYFNFYRAHTSSKESGVDNPTQDFSTALGGKWSGASQGQVTVDHALVRKMLDHHAPTWDTALAMVKRGGGGTGGGNVASFGHGATGTAYHEFGHSFAGLLDEYSTQVSDTPRLGPAPRGINIANSPEVEQCPWKHWIEKKTPGVGLFRGGAAGAEGAFRPTDSGCVMKSGSEFCVVCREAAVIAIYRRVRPIEKTEPEPGEILFEPQKEVTFRLEVMKPETHLLEVQWTFNAAPIAGARREITDAGVTHSLTVQLDQLNVAPGYRGRLTATVADTTAWVLADPQQRLRQKVTWTIHRPNKEDNN